MTQKRLLKMAKRPKHYIDWQMIILILVLSAVFLSAAWEIYSR
jgi:hypothetical protein